MSLVLLGRAVTGGFCPVGHHGEGTMVDNVQVVAMVQRDDRMIGPIDFAVMDDGRHPVGWRIGVVDRVLPHYRHAFRSTIS